MKLKPIKNKTELKKALNCIDEEFVQYGHSKHSLDRAFPANCGLSTQTKTAPEGAAID